MCMQIRGYSVHAKLSTFWTRNVRPYNSRRTLRNVADMAPRQNIGRLLAAMVASACSDTDRCNSWICSICAVPANSIVYSVQCYGPVCVTCYSFWRGAVLRVTAFGGGLCYVLQLLAGAVLRVTTALNSLRGTHSKVSHSERIFLRLRRGQHVLSGSACLLPDLLRSCLALPALRFSLSLSSCAMVHGASRRAQWRRRRQPCLRWPHAQPACRQPHPRHLTR